MAVTAYNPSAMLALAGDPGTQIIPLFPDMFTKPTKDLPQTFTDAGCFYVLNLDVAIHVSRFIDMLPVRGVVLPNDIGIDLDTEEDWNRLTKAYQQQSVAK
jgi:pseudaminic acid cytidylyltransferase